MPPRTPMPQRERDFDYAAIGKVGRRTGVTLAPRRLDDHGLEEMSGMFSSPRKPSSASKRTIMESVEKGDYQETPRAKHTQPGTPGTMTSVRRSVRGSSHPIPRSASPRKSGITGTARRSGPVVVLKQREEHMQEEQQEAEEEARLSVMIAQPQKQQTSEDSHLSATPVHATNARASSARPATARRFSPERTPLRNKVLNRGSKSAVVGRVSGAILLLQEEPAEDSRPDESPSFTHINPAALQNNTELEEDYVNLLVDADHDDEASIAESDHEEPEIVPPVDLENDDEDEDQTFEPPVRSTGRKGANQANSRRKRKSDALEEETAAASSPAAKRAKRKSADGTKLGQKAIKTSSSQQEPKTRKPLQDKSINTKWKSKVPKEVDDIIEKIKARPGPKKSLFILRKETPADDVIRTRSGRISIKPLAHWKNEGCVYGGSPGDASGIADNARFPLYSIKEIHRTEEVVEAVSKRSKGRKKNRSKSKAQQEDNSDLDIDGVDDAVDPDADDWELDTGTLKGTVAVWEHEQQAPGNELEDVDVAHANSAIETKEVKGQGFRYAKLLSTKFFGSGIVDLPAGAVKKPKNSRKMHMSFFVAQGRVTVEVGPMSGQATRFNIGKGGFWQVPRGNQYSIENEHGKSARIFFSQACEPAPQEYTEE